MRKFSAVLFSLVASTSLLAQVSQATVSIGQGALGCQGLGPVLSGGVVAGAVGDITYDQATGACSVTVTNNSPVVAGEANPVITAIYLNFPAGSVLSATLTGQSGSGGATPAFALTYDQNTGVMPNPNIAGCLGAFNVRLAISGNQGGIANAAAPLVSAPSPVVGPVTFDLQLSGPGLGGIDAEAVWSTTSQAAIQATNFGVEFQAGGLGGQDGGFVGGCDLCRNSIYTVGQATVGQPFQICATGGYGCHACVWVSAVPGPTVVGPYTIPIGLPLAGALDLGNFGLNGVGNSVCVPVNVPNNNQLSGFSFYVTNITYNALDLRDITFARAFTVTVN